MTDIPTTCQETGACPFPGTRSLNLAVVAAWRSRVASLVIVPNEAGCSVTSADGAPLEQLEASFRDIRREVDRRTRFPNHHQRIWGRIRYWLNERPVLRGGYWGCRVDGDTELSIYSFVRPDKIECRLFTAMSEEAETQNQKVDPIN